jgi:hypothetical protein
MSNEIQVMRFSETGLVRVRLAIESLRNKEHAGKGSLGSPVSKQEVEALRSLAFNTDLLERTETAVPIDPGMLFADRFEMSRYLAGVITSAAAETDRGLWTWLSIVYIEQLLAPRKDGTWSLASEYRYIPDDSRLRYYRHLTRMGWAIYRQYADRSKLFLSIPPYTHSDFVEQSQKDNVRSNPHLIDLCYRVFFDEKKSALKKGVASSVSTSGSFRRLVSIVSPQLYVNFDLYEMPAEKILGILPAEFSKWQISSA